MKCNYQNSFVHIEQHISTSEFNCFFNSNTVTIFVGTCSTVYTVKHIDLYFIVVIVKEIK